MTNGLFCVAAILALQVSNPAGRHTPAADYLLTSEGAGRIQLGTTVDELHEWYGQPDVRLVDLMLEGMFSPALKINLPSATVKPAIVAEIREFPCNDFSIWRIDVRDPRFRTSDGFGVGSTAGELKRAHALRINDEEGGHAAMVDDLRMSFSLTTAGPVDRQRVTSVLIWPDPETVRKKRCPGK
jgi:hypothetical protein